MCDPVTVQEKHMDAIIAANRERWNALADAHVMHSMPFFEFTREDAARYVYRHEFITDVASKRVLCLASGGGQDSMAFGLLGAAVTVLDLSDVQLSRDREGAARHGLQVETVQGDMRNLSMFADDAFDVVWQPYSLNYCPEVEPVFREVARVLRPGGLYHLTFANPLAPTLDNDWDDARSPATEKRILYRQGAKMALRHRVLAIGHAREEISFNAIRIADAYLDVVFHLESCVWI